MYKTKLALFALAFIFVLSTLTLVIRILYIEDKLDKFRIQQEAIIEDIKVLDERQDRFSTYLKDAK